ncbi:MAG: hypothetical protein VCB26_05890 [Candidatus Hydrogenedentota bacterium]
MNISSKFLLSMLGAIGVSILLGLLSAISACQRPMSASRRRSAWA